ncbi:glycosyltransferase [Bacillus subtilis]
MSYPLISIVIPVRNEFDRVEKTINSILKKRGTKCDLEMVIVDDASETNSYKNINCNVEIPIRIFRLNERVGVPRARNYGVYKANGDILFITDAHVDFSENWDVYILNNIRDNQIIAATICDTSSKFMGYGCSLVVPYMGTRWNRSPSTDDSKYVQIASSAGTILTKKLFEKIGGYDPGMILYGGAEPEFSLRAWLSGAEIVSAPSLHIFHRFKTKPEINRFLEGLRPSMVHNNLRFGLLYLSELACLQMIRHYTMLYPEQMQTAIKMLRNSDVWKRRMLLNEVLHYDFKWFVHKFNVKDQIEQEILF